MTTCLHLRSAAREIPNAPTSGTATVAALSASATANTTATRTVTQYTGHRYQAEGECAVCGQWLRWVHAECEDPRCHATLCDQCSEIDPFCHDCGRDLA